MSSKAPNYHAGLVRTTTTLILLLWVIATESPFAQLGLVEWQETFDSRCALADFQAFVADVTVETSHMPGLKNAVPALDELEAALQPWGADRERENRCMQLLLADQGKRLLQLNALHGLHSAVINEAWISTTLPPSFQWIPALTTGWNQSAHSNAPRAGLWWNTETDAAEGGATLNGAIDERGVPAESTHRAIAQLEKFQRRFPNDPHRVLVAYIKGMAFATRWTGRPGYDRQLDEWLALYKVISRMMVNTELPDHQLDWVDALSKWERVACNGEQSRTNLIEQQGLPADVLSQFLPWWTGSQLPCSTLDSYEVALPPAYASLWRNESVAQEVETPAATPSATSFTEIEPASYAVAYTCQLHEVKAGDTLWNISKRYPGTTPDWIAEINEITDYIRIGEVLCIPIQP